MNTFYLKFTDKTQAFTAFGEADLLEQRDLESPNMVGTYTVIPTDYQDLQFDVIGEIVTFETVPDVNSIMGFIHVPTVHEGFHVNVYGDLLPAALQPYEIPAPATPYRVRA